MNMTDLEKCVRLFADRLADAQQKIITPDFGELSVPAAIARLRQAFPGMAFNIQPGDLTIDYGGRCQIEGAAWTVGVHGATYKTFSGPTLAAAVNAALASLSPPSANPADDLEQALVPTPF